MRQAEFLKKRAQALLAGKKHLPLDGQARIVRGPSFRRYIITRRDG